MSSLPPVLPLPAPSEIEPYVARVLERCRALGASQAEASASLSRGLAVGVRKGEVESLEFQHDRELGITVYFGHRKGNSTTGDLSDAGIDAAVRAACDIARATGEDPCNGLADAALMAQADPDLDLDHPWDITPDDAIDLARACEAAAFAVDPRISHSEGASVDSHRGVSVYANSHGFVGRRCGTHHSLSCAVVASANDEMQRDYWYTTSRAPSELADPAAVGRRAGERAIQRLGARKLATRSAPVLLPPELARGLWSHFTGAISGSSLYRKASFLLDRMDQPVFSPVVHLEQQPFIPRGSASAAWDSEGVATRERVLVEQGVLRGWLLASYSARKLGLSTTGNAGGVFNLVVRPGARDFAGLVRDMHEGLVVTELLGHSVNLVNGDYSRGAAGYWVENGAIAYPVEELTIAGNLADMFRGIQALGADVEPHAAIRTGSVLLGPMTIAGG